MQKSVHSFGEQVQDNGFKAVYVIPERQFELFAGEIFDVSLVFAACPISSSQCIAIVAHVV